MFPRSRLQLAVVLILAGPAGLFAQWLGYPTSPSRTLDFDSGPESYRGAAHSGAG